MESNARQGKEDCPLLLGQLHIYYAPVVKHLVYPFRCPTQDIGVAKKGKRHMLRNQKQSKRLEKGWYKWGGLAW
jgi:hypothetical protein